MPKSVFYNTTVSFGGANFPASSASVSETIELSDVSDTGSQFVQRVKTLKDRSATVTVYSTGTAPVVIGANGTLTWTGSGAPSFPAVVQQIQFGQAQINGAIPITITFQGDGE